MPKIKVKGQTVQTGERPQTNGRTHTHTDATKTYYLPCYAVDNHSAEKINVGFEKKIGDRTSIVDAKSIVGLLSTPVFNTSSSVSFSERRCPRLQRTVSNDASMTGGRLWLR